MSRAGCGELRLVPDTPPVPGDAAGLRAANARLRELLAERDAQIAELRMQVAARDTQIAGLGEQLEQLGAQVAEPFEVAIEDDDN